MGALEGNKELVLYVQGGAAIVTLFRRRPPPRRSIPLRRGGQLRGGNSPKTFTSSAPGMITTACVTGRRPSIPCRRRRRRLLGRGRPPRRRPTPRALPRLPVPPNPQKSPGCPDSPSMNILPRKSKPKP